MPNRYIHFHAHFYLVSDDQGENGHEPLFWEQNAGRWRGRELENIFLLRHLLFPRSSTGGPGHWTRPGSRETVCERGRLLSGRRIEKTEKICGFSQRQQERPLQSAHHHPLLLSYPWHEGLPWSPSPVRTVEERPIFQVRRDSSRFFPQ